MGTIDRLTIEVQKLSVQPGDIVVFRCPRLMPESLAQVQNDIGAWWADLKLDATIMLVPPEWSIDCLTDEEMRAAGWQQIPPMGREFL